MPATKWSFGDRVIHADRPEWGEGQITAIQPVVIEGQPTQRLTIRFERAGVKKLAAAVANIKPAGQPPVAGASAGPAAHNEPEPSDTELAERLWQLPGDARDPFISLETRLAYTLNLYRFSDQGGSLLDWGSRANRPRRSAEPDASARSRSRLRQVPSKPRPPRRRTRQPAHARRPRRGSESGKPGVLSKAGRRCAGSSPGVDPVQQPRQSANPHSGSDRSSPSPHACAARCAWFLYGPVRGHPGSGTPGTRVDMYLSAAPGVCSVHHICKHDRQEHRHERA